MAKVELKQPIVAEISENIKDAQSVVLVDYRGLTVEQDTKLRKLCRENGVTYKVYKNTMMNFAFKGTQFEALAPYLEGPSAAAISTTDATAPARVLGKFAKEADKLEIKAAVQAIFQSKVKSVNTMNLMPKTRRVGRYSGKLPAYKKAIVRFDSSFDLAKVTDAVATEERKANAESDEK